MIYLLFTLMVIIFLIALAKQKKISNKHSDLKMTVLIPAKNEQTNIKNCLDAFINQNYSLNLIEFIILNDQSTDETGLIANSLVHLFPDARVIDIVPSERIFAKANALDQGIKIAKNEYIVICDADCTPNKFWLEQMSKEFANGADVVCGFTVINNTKNYNLFFNMQKFDWYLMLGAGSAAVALNKPISCIGSNLAFKKELYGRIGTYENLSPSLTEDLELFQAFAKEKVIFSFPLHALLINYTNAIDSVKTYVEQRKRWISGLKKFNFFGIVIFLILFWVHIFSVLTLFFEFSFFQLQKVSAIATLDMLVVYYIARQLEQKINYFYLPFYFFFIIANFISIPVSFLFNKEIIWKNKHYNFNGTPKK